MKIAYEKPAYLPTLRELMRCTQAFERFSAMHVRNMGLTASQFDVIATLGNTDGMTCKELGDKTLITKGTLTGVLDRMGARGLLNRRVSTEDARSTHVSLTRKGELLFAEVFPMHLQQLQSAFRHVPPAEMNRLREGLQSLRHAFEKEIIQ
jgi:MarR family transcriptional regulator, 2-MHQ and catechol-resistance regulon repressor